MKLDTSSNHSAVVANARELMSIEGHFIAIKTLKCLIAMQTKLNVNQANQIMHYSVRITNNKHSFVSGKYLVNQSIR